MTATDPEPPAEGERRMIVVRGSRFSFRWRARSIVVCSALAAATLLVSLLALTTGDFHVSVAGVWAALIDDPDAGFARSVVAEWRLPRAAAAVVFGAALGASGAVFQSLTRNPLASPDIIGFSTGSYTGALLVMTLIGGGAFAVGAGALAGGMATAATVYLLAWRRGGTRGFRLIVVGVAIAAMLGSFNTWLLLTAKLEVALSAAVWGAGSLTGTTGEQALSGLLSIVVLLAALIALAPAIRQLELGDDVARATGIGAETVRLTAIGIGVALIAIVTAAAGPIAFVALAAPQIAKRLVRSAGAPFLAAAFVGAFLLAGADVVAQHLLPRPLPVGVVTVIIGGGYLIWLLVREVKRRT